MTTLIFVLGLAALQAAPTPKKVEIVSATGCLKEAAPNNWTLVNATDPVPSTANAPPREGHSGGRRRPAGTRSR